MNLGLSGRLALVTGANKGIGLACAERLAAEGCRVHLVARTEKTLAAEAERLAKKHGAEVEFTALDLAAPGSDEALFAAVPNADVLVNNAGAIPSGGLNEVDEETWRQAWDLKVFGYINLSRRYLDAMRKRHSGVVINIIGAGGEKPRPGYIAGAGGNAALMAISRALGSSSLKDGVRVVGINPGMIVTERMTTLLKSQAQGRFGDEQRWQELIDPDFPPGKPEHIADMTAFLASDLSSNTTGTVITIDGGSCAR